MDEKVIIRSERYDVKKLFKIMVIIGTIISIISFLFVMIVIHMDNYDDAYYYYSEHQLDGHCDSFWFESWEKCSNCRIIEKYPSKIIYSFVMACSEDLNYCYLIPIAAFALIGGLIYLWLRSYELTVTNKRIYGTVAWGKRVDLPVDSVSSTATLRVLKGVSVSTSSGKIKFLQLKNAADIYREINKLLVERQKKETPVITPVQINTNTISNSPDDLIKLKELLDKGIITQEEFDTKKKQILGL